ncbi:ABC transporter permease [Mesorhizobium sp.]|uniref:ABC transporter permease n=1 Tax=Mesorhizobium sp. TaxID=1871066 RepID=UPI000FE6DB4E|nr:ABC transporter permease [Mesorhizobium sp.]RWC50524.1 MAG: ABC transporter permease [Mesorhizobium sp.]RWC61822.1 MAG: ABC transporter permease [Mesorhizobium sp.]RWC66399.1 MAG: ABC transporter permease [Mesorhizobium sp.]
MADIVSEASTVPLTNSKKPRGRTNRLMIAMLALPTFYSLVFFIGPLIFLIALSLWKVENFRVVPAFTLENYISVGQQMFGNSNYSIAILQSLYVAATTAALCVALCGAFVLALVYTLPSRLHRLALLLAVAPFWTSYILRVFAWQILLAKRGIINTALSAMGIDWQLAVLNTQTATRIGLLHYSAPVIIVILFVTVKSIDRDLIEAARNLGATRWTTFRTVILPLSRVGIVLSFCFASIIAFGDVLSGSILGGGAGRSLVGSVPLFANVIMSDYSGSTNLPRVCVLAIIMVLILVFILMAGMKGSEAAQRSIS